MTNRRSHKPLTPDRINWIVALLEAGKSQRETSRIVGVALDTVGRIYHGKYYGAPAPSLPPPREDPAPSLPPPREDPAPGYTPPSGPLVFCPACGVKVQQPCLACYLRKEVQHVGKEW